MDIEDLLREQLGPGSGRPVPSPDFEDRVRLSLTPRAEKRRHRAGSLAEALLALAAILALAAVGLPWLMGPHAAAPAGSTAPAMEPLSASVESAAATSPSPSPVPLAHATKWFLSFDYPASWTVIDRGITQGEKGLNARNLLEGEPAILGFVGNVTPSEDCREASAGTGVECTTAWNLAESTVVLRFEAVPRLHSTAGHPEQVWTSRQANAGTVLAGAEPLVVDGLPGRLVRGTSAAIPFSDETVPGATRTLWWGLPSQQAPAHGWVIVAAIRGPDADTLAAQAEALVRSIHFVPEPTMLPSDPAELERARAAALLAFYALQKQYALDENAEAYDCFPNRVGESRKATITQTPVTAPLTVPLPVTCTVDSMQPNAMQGWTVHLTQAWDAGSGYPAGFVSFAWTIDAAGHGYEGGIAGNSDPNVYPNIGVSKYPA